MLTKTFLRKYYIVIDVIIVLAIVVVYFTYPETSRITLEEVSTVFDGKEAVRNALVDEEMVKHAMKEGSDDKAVVVERREVGGEV
jgi:hypothetical protein